MMKRFIPKTNRRSNKSQFLRTIVRIEFILASLPKLAHSQIKLANNGDNFR